MKIILAVNAGSSSVKVSIFAASQSLAQIADAQIDGLTSPPPKLRYKRRDHNDDVKELDQSIKSQEDAFRVILDHLISDKALSELSSRNDIAYTTHRVVHGGDYDSPKIIDDGVYNHIKDLSDLAPLHNGPALNLVQYVTQELPNSTNVAFFDSSFHKTIPKHISTYPISPEIALRNKLRKYGFHGISYSFITRMVAQYLSKPVSNLNIIALHLGSGASACAIKNGQSYDTSMGLTPLAGLPGATRSGSIDPSLVFHFTNQAGSLSPNSTQDLHITKAEEILNKQSGWKSLTGTTDFGKISASDDPMCNLAFDLFLDRILGFVGSYYVALGGNVDALVFAGGIGEKGAKLRQGVAKRLECLGFAIDEDINRKRVTETITNISGENSKHQMLVCQTDEQYEMASECLSNILQADPLRRK